MSFFTSNRVIAALSQKEDGDMHFSGGKKTEENRKNFLSKLDIAPEQVVKAGLVHEDNIKIVGKEARGKPIPKTDGLLTPQKGVYLALTVADCLPVFLFEPEAAL